MTLLTICQDACNAAPIGAPSAIVGNTGDQTAVLLLALANRSGLAVSKRAPNGWVSMIREWDFQTNALGPYYGSLYQVSGGRGAIAFSQVIDDLTPNNFVVSGDGIPNNVTVTSVTYGTGKGAIPTIVGINYDVPEIVLGNYTFGQSDYALPPDFQAPINDTFWDRSRYWAMRGPMSPQQWQIYKSSAIGQASIERRYRFRTIGGPGNVMLSIDPVPMDSGSALVFEYFSNGWCQSAAGVPQTRWEADSDVGVLDEYLLTLDLQWRLLHRLGLSYNEELDEYEREVAKAIARDGSAPTLSLVPTERLHLIGPYQLPETGYGGVT
jgi:hypothetical protein